MLFRTFVSFFARLLAGAIFGIAVLSASVSSLRAAEDLSKEMILNDPAAPVAGNPSGDVTIVAFLDYNCPFCKKAAPDLERAVKTDGRVRLVYKDWPILTEASKYGARAALAAKYQGKYQEVHNALMAIPGRKITEDQMRKAIATSAVDIAQMEKDMKAHAAEIDAVLDRNPAQADGLGLQGTPVFLIGSFMVPAVLSYEEFQKVIAEARLKVAK
jgi:protein-disulfide isomerase